MNQAQREKYRRQLLALAGRLQGDVTGLAGETFRTAGGESSGSLSNAPLHLADLGTDHFNHELNVSLLESEEQALEEVAAALERLEAGTFGACEQCQKPIAAERLEAVPYARLCIDCARQVEQAGGDSRRTPPVT